jgi:hypothetical protein
LEAEIARQASIIRQLQARVAYLQHVVAVQRQEIGRLRGVIYRQNLVIIDQAIRLDNYRRATGQLVDYLWPLPWVAARIKAGIEGGTGIPAGSFGQDLLTRYKDIAAQRGALVISLADQRDAAQAEAAALRDQLAQIQDAISNLDDDHWYDHPGDIVTFIAGEWDNCVSWGAPGALVGGSVGGGWGAVAGGALGCVGAVGVDVYIGSQ